MLLFVTLLHIILCFVLMLVILLQPGKGADVGAAFGGGGGSSTIFGPRGAGSFLSQATTIVAVLFMGTSVTLAIYSNAAMRSGSDVEQEIERLQRQDQGEMFTIPEEERYVVPDEQAPAEVLFPAEVEIDAAPIGLPSDEDLAEPVGGEGEAELVPPEPTGEGVPTIVPSPLVDPTPDAE